MNKTGTREWSDRSVNCCQGCSHECLYCYARYNALHRFHRIASAKQWADEQVRTRAVARRYRQYPGVVMFPTTHDVTPGNLDACLTVLGKLLAAGNDVLLVTKPHRECMIAVCRRFEPYRRQLEIRCTIGSADDGALAYWEPHAPPFAERVASLMHAHTQGFRTSVSAEPLLSPRSVGVLVSSVEPYVTESIWIGKANQLRRRTQWAIGRVYGVAAAVAKLEAEQTDAKVMEVYGQLQGHPLVQWKDSYRAVIDAAKMT